MVAHVNKRPSLRNPLSAHHFISNKSELTKHPRPQLHKKISDGHCSCPKKSRDQNPRKEKQHEESKYE